MKLLAYELAVFIELGYKIVYALLGPFEVTNVVLIGRKVFMTINGEVYGITPTAEIAASMELNGVRYE